MEPEVLMQRQEIEMRLGVARADVERLGKQIAETDAAMEKLVLVKRDLEFQRRNAETQMREAQELLELRAVALAAAVDRQGGL